MRVILEVVKGPEKGETCVFEQHEAFVVGRKKNKKVEFRIPSDRYFSRYHMMIEVSPPHCFLRDLGSTNGTKVNGKKIRNAHLNDGDVISGGRTAMRVRIERPRRPPIVLRRARGPTAAEAGYAGGASWRRQRDPGVRECPGFR